MDQTQVMLAIHHGAQHLTPDEKSFFENALAVFKSSGRVADEQAPHIIALYHKVKFRETDVNELLAYLEANVLLLADTEQQKVFGARMAFDSNMEQLDMQSVGVLLKIRNDLARRQHETLARSAAQFDAASRRASNPPQKIGHLIVLDAAAKLMKNRNRA